MKYSIDPNLEKFKDVYLNDIRRGWMNRAMRDARDYLDHIHKGNIPVVNREMDVFADYLRDTKRSLDANRKQQQRG